MNKEDLKKCFIVLVLLAIAAVLILQFGTHTISLLERKSGAKEEERNHRRRRPCPTPSCPAQAAAQKSPK